jgi:hypothetical protein
MNSIPKRFGPDEMLRLAANAVNKIDVMGPRGTTLCTMDEIDALAGVAVLSGLLPVPGAKPQTNLLFTTRRKRA